ncbi:MAG: hypothetical protein LBS84_06515 [Clostridiales bacterium]|nr:hypothetical protein [Clostridiales bacterium]
MKKLNASLAVMELLEVTGNIKAFVEKYKLLEEMLDSENKGLLITSIKSKYLKGYKDTLLEELLNVIYEDEIKAKYEAKLFVLSHTSNSHKLNTVTQEYEEILQYAQTDDEKLEVLGFILSCYLALYDEENIASTTTRIKAIQGIA